MIFRFYLETLFNVTVYPLPKSSIYVKDELDRAKGIKVYVGSEKKIFCMVRYDFWLKNIMHGHCTHFEQRDSVREASARLDPGE